MLEDFVIEDALADFLRAIKYHRERLVPVKSRMIFSGEVGIMRDVEDSFAVLETCALDVLGVISELRIERNDGGVDA